MIKCPKCGNNVSCTVKCNNMIVSAFCTCGYDLYWEEIAEQMGYEI